MRAMTKPTPALFPGNLENKSAESLADEQKDAAGDTDIQEPDVAETQTPDSAPAATVTVELLHHKDLTIDGEVKACVPGEEVDLDARTANSLVGGSYAKLVGA